MWREAERVGSGMREWQVGQATESTSAASSAQSARLALAALLQIEEGRLCMTGSRSESAP